MSKIAERIKIIREKEGLTQEGFGKRIGGVARNTITAYETEARVPSKQAIQLICTTFHVNKEWLEYGTGEMYAKDLLDDLRDQYGLTPFEVELIRGFVKLDPNARKSLMDFFNNLVEVVTSDPDYVTGKEKAPDEKSTLHDELDKELDLQKKPKDGSTGSDFIAG